MREKKQYLTIMSLVISKPFIYSCAICMIYCVFCHCSMSTAGQEKAKKKHCYNKLLIMFDL